MRKRLAAIVALTISASVGLVTNASPNSAESSLLQRCHQTVDSEFTSERTESGYASCDCVAKAIAGDSDLIAEINALMDLPADKRRVAASESTDEMLMGCFGPPPSATAESAG